MQKLNKHILIIASYAPSILLFRKELILAFLEVGYAVSIVAPEPSDAQCIADIRKLGCQFIPIHMHSRGLNPLQDLKYMWNLKRCFKKNKPDLVFSYTIKPVIWGGFAAKLAGVSEVYSMITGLGYAFIDLRGWKKKVINYIVRVLYKWALRFNQFVWLQNPDDFSLLKKLGVIDPKKAGIINGSGINLEYFSVKKLSSQRSNFLLIARLLKDKGIYEFIEAARIMKARHPDVEFTIVGYIEDNPASIKQEELNSWVQSGLIHYLGKLKDVRQALEDCSVYVLPSYREGTPRSVLEAMAIGRAIITTDAPGCRETVISGVNGFLVPISDVAALVEKMEFFLQNPEQCSVMGQASRTLVKQKFDVNEVNKVILNKLMEKN